ncbi:MULTISPECIES: alpha/beta hydrolase [Ramlibacter]|uniref:Alpha/beta hydrolase n=1 Tax=Ramlibacter aquaticus TaxID=2780094 RepID=A0ABR9SJS3_9BURK|nr:MULTISPECIES: alpha/beta hydrolase [Ramlibacter]MBE7942419.1 alpha/beta hydrolase [Ramlibacter aquaticus]
MAIDERFHDPEWLDRMYNNRALVPDHADYFRRWTEWGVEAMRSHPCEIDVRYGPGPNEHLDIFPADTAGPAPVMIFIHGGYWRSLDKREHVFIAPSFNREGVCVVVPNYALCPAVTIPDIVMQMVSAVAWTWRNIARHGGDPSRITVVGHSAGGHLAAMMLSCIWDAYGFDLPRQVVRNALSISGLYDLEPVSLVPYLRASLQLSSRHALMASPAHMPAPQQGVLYSVAGADESDEFIRHNHLIQKAWGKKVVPVCEDLAGLNHFSVLEPLADPQHHLHKLALELLRA